MKTPTAKVAPTYAPVPALWPGETIAILATGPSLCADDVQTCRRAGVRMLAIKAAIQLAPDADALYACDGNWWKTYGPTLTYAGPKYSLDETARPWASVLKHAGELGLSADPCGLKTGRNSGYQAIGLAVHLGATRIVLLGYDLQSTAAGKHHCHPEYPWKPAPHHAEYRGLFRFLVQPLEALGIGIVNASRVSALTDFPRLTLHDALKSHTRRGTLGNAAARATAGAEMGAS